MIDIHACFKSKYKCCLFGLHLLGSGFGCSWMYWTDWEEDEVNDSIGRIEKAWMDGSNRKIFVTSNMLWPNGLTLDHGTSTMYWCDAYYDHIERIYLNGTGRMVSEIAQMLLFLNLEIVEIKWDYCYQMRQSFLKPEGELVINLGSLIIYLKILFLFLL